MRSTNVRSSSMTAKAEKERAATINAVVKALQYPPPPMLVLEEHIFSLQMEVMSQTSVDRRCRSSDSNL